MTMRNTGYSRGKKNNWVRMAVDSNNVLVHFFGDVSSLRVEIPHEGRKVHSIVQQCLSHIQTEVESKCLNYYSWDLAMILPAFGLTVYKQDEIWLASSAEVKPGERKELRLRVRFRLPAKMFLSGNFLCDYLFLQVRDDYVNNRFGLAAKSGQLMDYLSRLLFLPQHLPLKDDQVIDSTYHAPHVSLFNLNKLVAKEIYNLLISKSIFDRYWRPVILKDKFKELMQQKLKLSNYKRNIYQKLMRKVPDYCFEVFVAISEDTPDTDVEKGREVTVRMKIYSEDLGKDQEAGMYYGDRLQLTLSDIVSVEIMKTANSDDKGRTVAIYGKNLPPKSPIKLRFEAGEEEAEAFLSMVKGFINLCQCFDLPMISLPSLDKGTQSMSKHTCGPMNPETAHSILQEYQTGEAEEKVFLIYQDTHQFDLYRVIHKGPGGVIAEGHDLTFIISDGGEVRLQEGSDNHTFKNPRDLWSYLVQKFGRQILPWKCPTVAEINKIFMEEKEANAGAQGIEYQGYTYLDPDFEDVSGASLFLPSDIKNLEEMKETIPIFKFQVKRSPEDYGLDKNPYVKRSEVEYHQHKFMMVELRDKKPQDEVAEEFSKGLVVLQELWRLDKIRVLQMYGSPIMSRHAMVMEYPPMKDLWSFISRKQRLEDLVLVACQIIDILELIEKSQFYHGNLRTRKFYVCKDLRIKLGDPGAAYFLDSLDARHHFNIERLPWLSPTKRKNLKLRNYQTECYAVGTTLCEMLYGTDEFSLELAALRKSREEIKAMTRGDIDKDMFQYFEENDHLPRTPVNEDHTATARDIVDGLWELIELCWKEQPCAKDLLKKAHELRSQARDLNMETMTEVERMLYPLEVSGLPQSTEKTTEQIDSFMQKTNKFRIPSKLISIDKRIGKGHFSEVFKGTVRKPRVNETEPPEDIIVAIKRLKRTNENTNFIKELEIACELEHPNIVKLLYYSYSKINGAENFNTLVMEYMDKGCLYENLRKNRTLQDSRSLKTKICQDIIKGMRYLSEKRIVHRDLAARNVLCCEEPNPSKLTAKVSDFGLARHIEANYSFYRSKQDGVLNIYWMPPETLTLTSFDTKGDIWSFGVVMWEIFTNGLDPQEGYRHVLKREFSFDILSKLDKKQHLPSSFMKENKDFVDAVYLIMSDYCWQHDPNKRCFFADLENEMENIKKRFVDKP